MAVKKNVPGLRFSEFSGEWEEKKLGKLVTFHRGSGLAKSDLSDDGVPCILYGELYTTYGEIINEVVSKTNSDKRLFMSNINDVLIPSSGETAEDISCASTVLVCNVALGGDLNILRPGGNINGSYLSYLINSAKKNDISKIAQGASVVHVYSSGLSKLNIIIPSLPEQTKIANFFTLIDEKIEKQQDKVTNLEDYKKGIMQKIFPKRGENIPELRFKGFTDPWEQCKLGEITQSFSGGTPSAGNSQYYGGAIPFIRSGEISSDKTELFVTEAGLNNSSAKMVKVGDVLYALYGATSGEVSISRINGAINQAILAIRSTENDDHYIITQWLRIQKERIISTYLQGGQGNLSGSIVKELMITLPSDKEEQKLISSFLSNLDNLITIHQRKLEELRELKKGFMHKMFV